MNSTVIKRSVYLAGRTTSISLEDDFWNSLRDARGESLSDLVTSIVKHAVLNYRIRGPSKYQAFKRKCMGEQ